MPDVMLTINGRQYQGWTGVRIYRGIEQQAGMFDLTVSERWPGQEASWPIIPGDRCTLAVDGEIVITGFVDDIQPQFDAGSHRLAVIGRDATCDLVDCSAANVPGRWENRTLTQIVQELCEPFGIEVKAKVNVGPAFKVFSIQPGEMVFDAIDRLCRYRGVMPVSDGRGALVITGPGTERLPARLVQGENILAGSAMITGRDRYSHYIVKGSDIGFDSSTPEQNAGPKGETFDPNVKRHRPLVIIGETPADATKLKERATWEASVRRGRSSRALVTVQGWHHPDGVWTPNQQVNVSLPWLRMEGTMLIVSVTLHRDRDGSRTDLEIAHPDGFKLMAVEEKEELF